MSWDKIPGLKNVTKLGVVNISGSGIAAIFWLYLGNLMGEENYGEIAYMLSIAGIAMSITIWGSEKAIVVYTAKGLNIQPPIYIISLITTGIGAIILYVMFNNFGLSLYVLGGVISQLAVAELLGRKQFTKYSKFFILQKILFVLIALGLYFILGPQGILLGFAISCLIYAQRIYKTIKKTEINFGLIKEKSGFIFNNYLIDLTAQLNNQMDKLIIGPIFGFIILGNYYLAIQILNLLTILPEVVSQYTIPQDASGNSTKSIKIFSVIISIVLVIVTVFTAPIIMPVLFPEFEDAIMIIPIISISIIPMTITYNYISKFFASEKTRIILASYLIEIIVLIPGVIILGNLMGVIGLGIIFVISTSVKASFLVIMDYYLKYQNTSKND
jgi:O-antigen/teichoic acid export membrane protein|tara:strand:+ start:43 stop:1200 length:1158 start_codon:yes stop_codon:yes gene_type:complete